MDLITVLLASVVVLFLYFWFLRADGNYPPQPSRPLPVVGHLFSLEDDLRPQYKKWHKDLGEIFSLNMAGTIMVVINGYDLIKEIFVKRADEFSDRAPFFLDKATGMPCKGIVFANGKTWKEQRATALSILRNLGMGKDTLAQIIQDEVGHFMQLLAQLEGRPTKMRINMNMGIANIICSFLLGRRFEYDDPTFQKLMQLLRYIVGNTSKGEIVSVFPILSLLPGDQFHSKRLAASSKAVIEIIVEKFIREIQDDTSEDVTPSNFVTLYLEEMERKRKTGEKTTMDEENLAKSIFDFLVAGTETTSTSLLWCLLYALNYPEVQEKIFKEIENEIGLERAPTSQDRTKLVYLNAFLAEVSRLASVAAHAFTHYCPQETTVKGYKIPKDSIIIPNLDSVMYDKKIWGNDVMSFKPERFINQEGKLHIPEQLIPFGIGRRICLGEGMAQTIRFLIMSSMFQRFQLLPRDAEAPPSLGYVFGADVSPQSFEIRFVDRRGEI
ncbi:cytochrome P450 2J3 [Biomphalaria glabrata]|nr:cytochrome P450 2J3-like [Biomphalaria glabrata]